MHKCGARQDPALFSRAQWTIATIARGHTGQAKSQKFTPRKPIDSVEGLLCIGGILSQASNAIARCVSVRSKMNQSKGQSAKPMAPNMTEVSDQRKRNRALLINTALTVASITRMVRYKLLESANTITPRPVHAPPCHGLSSPRTVPYNTKLMPINWAIMGVVS